jgi:hypothetical protein
VSGRWPRYGLHFPAFDGLSYVIPLGWLDAVLIVSNLTGLLPDSLDHHVNAWMPATPVN